MSELAELVRSVFDDAWDTSSTAFDTALWATLEETGLARLALPESVGGSGGTHTDAAELFHAAGRFAARVPLVETEVAGALLDAAGVGAPAGPLAAVRAPEVVVAGERVSGTLPRVPWGRAVAGVVVVAVDHVVLLTPSTARIEEGHNLAEEPRDTLVLDSVPAQVAPLPAGAAAEAALRAALGRSQLLAGAAYGALAMAVRYATERMQFGRPIARLQAVQQALAFAAAEVAAAEAASRAAAGAVDRLGFGGAEIAVAAAASRCARAAGEVARTAHQVHGAIGFTREHDLRVVTTRLWAWRDEDGGEETWNDLLGDRALRAGAAGLWPLLVG